MGQGDQNPIVLDTNIVLYHITGTIRLPVLPNPFILSSIIEIELLSFPSISQLEEEKIRAYLSAVDLIPINKEVIDWTITIRRKYKTKIPDAIIAATSIVLNAELMTNDADMKKIKELKLRSSNAY